VRPTLQPGFARACQALEDFLEGVSAPAQHHVPLREVSGICLGRGRNGRMFLLAIGDRVAKIAWFPQPRSDEGRIDWHTRNIAKLSGSMLPKHDPQIEAVCADGLGRILLLQETPPRVELVDSKALKVIASIDLAVEGRGEIAQAWADPKGSRGEGMVLPGDRATPNSNRFPDASQSSASVTLFQLPKTTTNALRRSRILRVDAVFSWAVLYQANA
jgi:hypothetical protein